MQSQPAQFQLPIKGVVKGLAYSDHPAEAAIDALNVLPFDTSGRLRLSPRPGTSKLWAAAMAVGNVQAIGQVITAIDPSSITPSVTLVNEPFTYANGGLAANSGGLWSVWNNNLSFSGTIVTTNMTVSSNTVINTPATLRAARYTPATVLGSAYIIRVSVTPGTNTNECGIIFRAAIGTTNALAVTVTGAGTLRYYRNQVQVGSNVVTGVSTLVGSHTLEVQVNGDVILASLDGVLYLSVTDTANNTQTEIGFAANTTVNTDTFDNFKVFTGTALASYRRTSLVAVCRGVVYIGDINTAGVRASDGGLTPKSSSGAISMCSIFGKAYIADGLTNLKVLNLTTGAIADIVPTAGTETAASLGVYQLAAVYRGRLVLGADRSNPQNFVISRVGVPTDFNYATTDTATAFAGNAAKAGQIGEPIVALMPFSDDIMLIGGDHNLWAVRGDPADGGSIDMVSDAVGILGKDAWTKSPDGTIYFIGTGGLYRMSPSGSVPENISSQKWNEYFSAINRASNYVTCAWDRDRHQLFIFVVPVNTGAAVSLVYDERTEGFWPIAMPDTQGPICATVYDGDGPTDRQILLGGRDGYIYRAATTNLSDDGTAINSYIYIGPAKTDDTTESVIDLMEVVMGKALTSDADWNCSLSLVAGQTVEQAFTAPLHTRTKTLTASGRQSRWFPKIRGNSFFLKIANSTVNKTWVFERATAQMTPSSIIRRKV